MPDRFIDYKRLFRTMPAHAMMLDRELCFLDVNDAFVANTGVSRGDVIGRPIFEVFPPAQGDHARLEAAFRQTLEMGVPTQLEELHYSVPDPDGTKGALIDKWWSLSHAPVVDVKGRITHLIQIGEDVTEQVRARKLKDAVLAELQHRIGNMLSLVTTIARRTADHEDDRDMFLARFTERVQALAATQKALTGDNWDGVTLRALLEDHLAPYRDVDDTRITVDGSALRLSPGMAQSISLALHELTTNSAKHGALAAADGATLRIAWSGAPGDDFNLEWCEDGLTGADGPSREGFGTMILTRICPAQIGGTAHQEFGGTRYAYRLEAGPT